MADRLSDYVLDALDETIQRVRANPQNGKIAFVQVHDGILERLIAAYREVALDMPPSVDGLDAGEKDRLPQFAASADIASKIAAAVMWLPWTKGATADEHHDRYGDVQMAAFRTLARNPISSDWGDRALTTAELILAYMGEGGEASKEPGADPVRDTVCRIIEDALTAERAALTASPAGDDPKALDAAARSELRENREAITGEVGREFGVRSSSTEAVEQEVERLRDEFAGQALIGILAGGFADTIPHDDVGGGDQAAFFAYQYADAMLARRTTTTAPSLPGKEEGRG